MPTCINPPWQSQYSTFIGNPAYYLYVNCDNFDSPENPAIVPLHENGLLYDLQNYRPINHTCILTKLIEGIFKDQLTEFLTTNDFIGESQHGFLKHRSCTPRHWFFHLVIPSVNRKKSTVFISLDMTEAFDLTPRERSLLKIKSYGSVDPLHHWFTYHLSDHSQVVSINGDLSQTRPITNSGIQGSVFGLWPVPPHIKGIFQAIRHSIHFLFADDIKLFYFFELTSLFPATASIMEDLSSLDEWWAIGDDILCHHKRCSCL